MLCRTEWIQMHDGSQHKTQPTADEAIERAHQRLYADNNARRTLAYQLLAFAASAQPRLGGAVMRQLSVVAIFSCRSNGSLASAGITAPPSRGWAAP